MLYLLTLKDTIDHTRELRVLEWHRREGEWCSRGELLVELESFKAIIEIRVDQSAFLRRVIVQEGQSEALGRPIAVFSDDLNEAVPDSLKAIEELAVEYAFM